MRDVEKQVPTGPPETGTPPAGGFSRREFLKGSSAAAVATALATSGTEAQAQDTKPNVAPAKPQKITLNVNGKDHAVTVEPRTLLLTVLRNQLNLTGCKDIDERDAAGADTVMIDGKPVLAGSRLAIECQGKKIKTVESLSNGENDRRGHRRLRQARCHAMRHVHAGLRDGHAGLPRQKPERHAQRNPKRPGRQHLPLRDLRRHYQMRPRTGERRCVMAREVAWKPHGSNNDLIGTEVVAVGRRR